MNTRYYIPWVGRNYEASRTLIMSESCYDWIDSDGQQATPQPSHPTDSIRRHFDNCGYRGYFPSINRMLTGEDNPPAGQLESMWNQFAYTIYVQESVGNGPGQRPNREQWEAAKKPFLDLIEEIEPKRVILTGVDMWNHMPLETARFFLKEVQAYRLSNGGLVWCLALPHPANRATGQGFNWRELSETVNVFLETIFPPR